MLFLQLSTNFQQDKYHTLNNNKNNLMYMTHKFVITQSCCPMLFFIDWIIRKHCGRNCGTNCGTLTLNVGAWKQYFTQENSSIFFFLFTLEIKKVQGQFNYMIKTAQISTVFDSIWLLWFNVQVLLCWWKFSFIKDGTNIFLNFFLKKISLSKQRKR